jgi:hypothetical protein
MIRPKAARLRLDPLPLRTCTPKLYSSVAHHSEREQ